MSNLFEQKTCPICGGTLEHTDPAQPQLWECQDCVRTFTPNELAEAEVPESGNPQSPGSAMFN